MIKKISQERDFGERTNSRQAWNSAKNILGIKKSLTPTSIKDSSGRTITNPSLLASDFNDYFVEKVRLLSQKTDSPTIKEPIKRVKNWLARSGTTAN